MINKFNTYISEYLQFYIICLGIITPIWLYVISLIKYDDANLALVLIITLFSVMLISWAGMQKVKNKIKSSYSLYAVGAVLQVGCYVNVVQNNVWGIEPVLHIVMFVIISLFMGYICKAKMPKYDEDKAQKISSIFSKYLIAIGPIMYIPAYLTIDSSNKQIRAILANSKPLIAIIPNEVRSRLDITKLVLVAIILCGSLLMYVAYNKAKSRVIH